MEVSEGFEGAVARVVQRQWGCSFGSFGVCVVVGCVFGLWS